MGLDFLPSFAIFGLCHLDWEFVVLPQLLQNKRASRRQKDLADVEALTPGKQRRKEQS
jgi:hypothetical protein